MAPRDDETLLRRAFEVARRSRANGDHPSVRCWRAPTARRWREQCNGYSCGGADMTAHAERLLATWGVTHRSTWVLPVRCTPYVCRALRDVFRRDDRAGIGRVVYGQSERALKAMTGAHAENPTLDLPCHRLRRRPAGERK